MAGGWQLKAKTKENRHAFERTRAGFLFEFVFAASR
jgi:hypothetical protein